MNDIFDITVSEETKIEGIADQLYRRIGEEVEKILVAQLKILGVENRDQAEGLKKTIFPDDDKGLAIYEYNGIKILGVRISDNNMGIHFDIPNLETQSKGEVQDV